MAKQIKKKKQRPLKVAPATVNNYLKNKPTIARSRSLRTTYDKPRDVEEVKPVVNGKVADANLIHKSAKLNADPFFPVIEKGRSDGTVKKSVKRRTGTSKK